MGMVLGSKRLFVWYFAVVFVPMAAVVVGILCTTSGIPLSHLAASAVALSGVGILAAAFASYQFARLLQGNIESVCLVLNKLSERETTPRIPISSRGIIAPIAHAVDRMQESLGSHFAEVRDRRDQLNTVLNTMVEGVIVVDANQLVLLHNQSAQRLFQLPSVGIGRPVFELVRQPQLLQWIDSALRQRITGDGELELHAPRTRTLRVRVQPLSQHSPNAGAMIVATDISQLRKLEMVRQEFVANASHELKTPLASINSCIETLLDYEAINDLEVRDRFLEMIREQSVRLDNLVRDLLALTRIESEGRRAEFGPFAIAPIIEQCAKRQLQNANKKTMQLIVSPPETPVFAMGDDESLEHILENLVDNAIKYTNSGGRIEVRWYRKGDSVTIEVEDTGIGIPQNQLERIFERFYRVDKARSREVGGTGLGLSIVKHLAQNLGGAVTVRSQIGVGSVFSVKLQAADAKTANDSPLAIH